MQNPLSAEEFFNIFREYNEGIWPLQWVLVSVCAVTAFFAFFVGGVATRGVLALLSILSAWIGLAYFWAYYTPANGVGWVFGWIFLIQAVLLGVHARRATGEVWFGPGVWAWIGAVLVLYAVAFYPLTGMMFGRTYPETPILGSAPCPTVIFMIGLLICAQPPISRWLFVVPIVWAVFGVSAVSYGIVEDLGLGVAGLAALAYSIGRLEVKTSPKSRHRPAATH